jgi:predicted N-acyltransferase
MNEMSSAALTGWRVEVATREDLMRHAHWEGAFASGRKDRRYYELVEDTILQGFDYRYFVIRDAYGQVRAVQPFFLLDQDMLGGIGGGVQTAANFVRRYWPGFLRMRTLMVGCAAGEGHLDCMEETSRHRDAELLAAAIQQHAVALKARLIVLKEFPAEYRNPLESFRRRGFTRVPSLPMVTLDIDYSNFEDYLQRGVPRRMRTDLRRKFKAASRSEALELSVMNDITPVIEDVYPLYLQVYKRSQLHFELLTKDYLCRIGRAMPDKVRFFVWRQSGNVVAFNLMMVHGDAIYSEYLGMDYSVAFRLHMYFQAFRDTMSWAMANGYKRYVSTSLNYDPKRNLRFKLYPLDLYVRHTSSIVNVAMRWLLPLIEPTRYDKTLRRFANYSDLWAGRNPAKSAGILDAPQRGGSKPALSD